MNRELTDDERKKMIDEIGKGMTDDKTRKYIDELNTVKGYPIYQKARESWRYDEINKKMILIDILMIPDRPSPTSNSDCNFNFKLNSHMN